MNENRIISRGELTAITGVPEDVLGFWIKLGLIVGQSDGPGDRRQFNMRELRMALLLREARSLGLTSEAMRAIVTPLREALLFFDTLPYCANHAKLAEVMDDVHWGNTGQLEAMRSELSEEDFELFSQAIRMLTPERRNDFWMAWGILHGEDMLAIHRDENGEWVKAARFTAEHSLPAGAVIAFDLARILDPAKIEAAACRHDANRRGRPIGRLSRRDVQVAQDILEGVRDGTFPSKRAGVKAFMGEIEGPSAAAKMRRLYRMFDRVEAHEKQGSAK